MNLNDQKIVVAIENAVRGQLEASGITTDPFRLDGEKIVDAILEQLGDFVLVEKKNIEHWYLDESENMWWEQTDWLCDLSIGEIEEVEHKQYLVTDQSKKYAAITWDEPNDDVGYYELYDTREEAEKAAAYCKAKVKAQGEGHE